MMSGPRMVHSFDLVFFYILKSIFKLYTRAYKLYDLANKNVDILSASHSQYLESTLLMDAASVSGKFAECCYELLWPIARLSPHAEPPWLPVLALRLMWYKIKKKKHSLTAAMIWEASMGHSGHALRVRDGPQMTRFGAVLDALPALMSGVWHVGCASHSLLHAQSRTVSVLLTASATSHVWTRRVCAVCRTMARLCTSTSERACLRAWVRDQMVTSLDE